jgi:hypothetical protein
MHTARRVHQVAGPTVDDKEYEVGLPADVTSDTAGRDGVDEAGFVPATETSLSSEGGSRSEAQAQVAPGVKAIREENTLADDLWDIQPGYARSECDRG